MLALVSSITTTVIGCDLVVEDDDRLRLVVVEDLEVFLRQVGDEALLRIDDRGEKRDHPRARPEGRLLRARGR